MNPTYTILVNADNTISMKEVMKRAHRRTKYAIQDGDKNSYASILKDELYHAWQWAKAMQEYNGRKAA